MTRINAIGGGAPGVRRPGRATGGFTLPGAGTAAAAGRTAPSASIAPLIALQEQAPQPSVEERSISRARAVLEELRGLQLDLLRGQTDPTRLARLASLSESQAVQGDAALRDIVFGIALRARLELARRRPIGQERVVPASASENSMR